MSVAALAGAARIGTEQALGVRCLPLGGEDEFVFQPMVIDRF